MVIFLWKISQGLVSGYSIPFTHRTCRTGRKIEPVQVLQSTPASVRNARAGTLAVKGAQLFNLLPESLRNSEHRDLLVFKNQMDVFLENIPDEPTIPGLVRAAETNSLLQQIPLYNLSLY
jgi:hypothetical protein